MKAIVEGIATVVAGLGMFIVMIIFNVLPWVISIYCGLWVLDYFGITNVLN